MIDRVDPGSADVLDLSPHALRIDACRSRERAEHDRNVVFLALAIDDIGEEKRLALLFRHAADELPAHQRMKLGILVDRPVDADEQALRFEIGEMLLKI